MKEVIHELYSEEQVNSRIKEIADELNKKYEGKTLHVIGILRGGVMFFVELVKNLEVPVTMDFIAASSYGDSTVSSGNLHIEKDLDDPIDGRNVIIVEDIIDTGNTLSKVRKMLQARNPESLEICTLLDKPDRRETDVVVEYTGFKIPDEFVVGYGLDYAQRYRNLKYIGVLEMIEE